MEWRRGAGKICRGICYFGIWVHFMMVASYVYSLTNSGFLMAATIFLINLLFWHAMSYIQNKTDALYKEIEKQKVLQEIRDDLAWNGFSRTLRDILLDNIYTKPTYTLDMLVFKTWYINRMREITLGVKVWRT